MGLEAGTFISNLVVTNPLGVDDRSTADDHIRLLKSTIKNTFPNINAAMNATDEQLNLLVGLLANAAELNILDGATVTTTELNLLSGKILLSSDNVLDNLPAGSLTTWQQTTAPIGWTKQTTHNDKSLRVVSGVAGSGGVSAFTTVFGAGKTTDSHTLTAAEIPAHNHGSAGAHTHTIASAISASGALRIGETNNNFTNGTHTTSSAGAHTHSTFGSSGGHVHNISNLNLQYVDVIIASKD